MSEAVSAADEALKAVQLEIAKANLKLKELEIRDKESDVVKAAQVYTEVCKDIRETDDISFKLIGLIPLLSGGSILTFVVGKVVVGEGVVHEGIVQSMTPIVTFLALFAGAVTLALYRWELRNIQTCIWLME